MNIKRQRLIIISTFVMGLFTGVYLYLIGFAPTYSSVIDSLSSHSPTFVVEAEQYGGCERTGVCASFRLDDTRGYRYFPYTPYEVTSVVHEGTLSQPTYIDLLNTVEEADLATLAVPVSSVTCPSMADGIDYRYTVLYAGKTYHLDTCHTRLGQGSPLGHALELVWRELDE